MWPRDVIGHTTTRLPGVNFLSVVYGDHASIWKEKSERVKRRKRERNRGRKREKGKEKQKRGKGKGKGKEMEKGKKMEKGKGKGKEKGRWKEDSLRNVGRMDACTNTKVILYFVQCYALH